MEVVRRGAMRPLGRAGVIVTVTSVAVSFLTVCLPGVGAAQASALANPSTGVPGPWAYGGLVSRGWSGSAGVYPYKASELVGFAVVLHESTGTGDLLTVQVNRTMGVILSVTYCAPSCSRPRVTATVTYHAWEVVHAALNLTSAGSVTVNGTQVPALALQASNLSVAVGLREQAEVVRLGTVAYDTNLSVGLDANSSTVFTPALGLVPLSLSAAAAPENWTNTSSYNESGAGTWSVVATGNVTVDVSGPVQLDGKGSVTVNGTYGGKAIRLGGGTYDVLGLKVVGPFRLREGFLLLPTGSDLFGATAPAWLTKNVTPSGSASFSEENVDVASPPTGGSHLGFEGSEVAWTSAAGNPASTSDVSDFLPAVTPTVAGPNTTSVQGGPESLAQATTDQNCLASGVGCPTSSAPRGLFGELLVVGGGAAAVVIAAVLITERRRMPRTRYPNAALYPPGPAPTGAPDTDRRPGPPPPPPTDDPLGHLW